jgi:hypothetical protein
MSMSAGDIIALAQQYKDSDPTVSHILVIIQYHVDKMKFSSSQQLANLYEVANLAALPNTGINFHADGSKGLLISNYETSMGTCEALVEILSGILSRYGHPEAVE